MVKASLQIAVVDDEEPVRRALERLLRTEGFTVDSFSSGEEFLRSLPHRLPDWAVLDLHMPFPDGWAVLTQLSEHWPAVRVIVITGRDTPESQERAKEAGVEVYLRKPVDRGLLLDAIRTSAKGL